MSLDFRIQLEKGFAAKFKKDVEREIRNTILKALPRVISAIEKQIQTLVVLKLEAAP